MANRSLTALPVYNEVDTVDDVLDQVCKYSHSVLVVDDGSTDGTAERLAARRGSNLHIATHAKNRGYGAALQTAFQFADDQQYDTIVTVDCDGQHEPRLIPQFVEASQHADIVSGSRYLAPTPRGLAPPEDRRRINRAITEQLNQELGLQLSDAFCGFKAYRVELLDCLDLTEDGYAMPLQLWVQAAALGWKITELPVPLIYLDASRSFGEALDDADARLRHYRRVIERSRQGVTTLLRDRSPLCGESVG